MLIIQYNIVNWTPKNTLKTFVPNTWCTKKPPDIKSHTTDTFQLLVQDSILSFLACNICTISLFFVYKAVMNNSLILVKNVIKYLKNCFKINSFKVGLKPSTCQSQYILFLFQTVFHRKLKIQALCVLPLLSFYNEHYKQYWKLLKSFKP